MVFGMLFLVVGGAAWGGPLGRPDRGSAGWPDRDRHARSPAADRPGAAAAGAWADGAVPAGRAGCASRPAAPRGRDRAAARSRPRLLPPASRRAARPQATRLWAAPVASVLPGGTMR